MRFVAGWGAKAKSHQEDAAGRGAVAELLAGSAMARGCAVAEMLLPGRSIGKRGKKHARRKSSI